MCGRYFIQETLSVGVTGAVKGQAGKRRDICPGASTDAEIISGGEVRTVPMEWGFRREKGGLVINARVESLGDRPMFSGLVERQRCALPASGYYEWRRADRQRYVIELNDVNPFHLAGLYRTGESGPEFVVLTQPPADLIKPVHDRMPVILPDAAAVQAWLKDGVLPESVGSDVLQMRADGDEQLRMPF